MRKIVIPTDFSKNAFNALYFAASLFKYTRCEFYILHAYAERVYQADELDNRELLDKRKLAVYKEVDEELFHLKEKITECLPNPKHEFKMLSAFGVLSDEVNDLVNSEDIDIVVMGTRGKTNDRKITFGTNTVQVMKYVQCPVLAVPEDYEYHEPREVLFPSDYMVPYKRRELKLLCEIAGSFRSNIHMLYINPIKKLSMRQEDHMNFLKECLFKAQLSYETTEEEDKTMAITKYILHNKIDMLVMVNSRHSHLEELLYQSTLEKIGLHIKIPFLVFQNLSR
jgi:nucleotide-binding universal stress UspA family protein